MELESISLATRNQVEHSEAVLNAHGSTGSSSSALWVNGHSLSIPYPHAITLGSAERARDHISQFSAFLASRPESAPASVVDTYSSSTVRSRYVLGPVRPFTQHHHQLEIVTGVDLGFQFISRYQLHGWLRVFWASGQNFWHGC